MSRMSGEHRPEGDFQGNRLLVYTVLQLRDPCSAKVPLGISLTRIAETAGHVFFQ
jgi:hypothetical protein